MYVQTFNAIAATMKDEYVTQNYQYFVHRQTERQMDKQIDTRGVKLMQVYSPNIHFANGGGGVKQN